MGQVVFKLEADEAKAVQGILRVTDALKKAGAATDGLKRQGKSMGARFAMDLKAMALGYIGIGAAVAIASKALAKMNEIRERGAKRAKTAESSLQKLVQLSGGDTEELQYMMAGVRETSASQGVSLERAAGLQFALESNQAAGYRKRFGKTFQLLDDPAVAVESAATLQKAMGRGETGDLGQVLNKLFAAAAVSKTTVEQLGPAASQAAKSVGRLGGTDEEFLASLSQLSRSTKDVGVAATQIQSFADAILKRGIKADGLLDAARQIQAMGIPDAKLQEFFGRKEGTKGFLNLVDQAGAIRGTTADLNRIDAERGENDLLGRLMKARASDPLLDQLRRGRIAEAPGNTFGAIAALQEQQIVDLEAREIERRFGSGGGGRALVAIHGMVNDASMTLFGSAASSISPSESAAERTVRNAFKNTNAQVEGGP